MARRPSRGAPQPWLAPMRTVPAPAVAFRTQPPTQPPPGQDVGVHMAGLREEDDLKAFLAASQPTTAVVEYGTSWCQKCHEIFPTYYALSKHVRCGDAAPRSRARRRARPQHAARGHASPAATRPPARLRLRLRPAGRTTHAGGRKGGWTHAMLPCIPSVRPLAAPQYPQHKYAVAQVENMKCVVKEVRYSPTFAIYKNGKKVDEVVGNEPQRLADHLWLHSL